MSFLRETAETVIQRHAKDLSRVAVVFQNRRAALYFKHHIAEQRSGASWLPSTYSIQDFLCQGTGLRRLDSVELYFKAFSAYRGAGGMETLEEFSTWAPTALADFDEIDHYRVDVPGFFKSLRDIKRIEAWNVDSDVTPLQRKYLDHLAVLEMFYDRLTAVFASLLSGTDGWIARRAADDPRRFMETMPGDHVYFVGFNAVTACEAEMIKHLLKVGRADVIVDGDAFYVNDPIHEAGAGLRMFARLMNWDHVPGLTNHYKNGSKDIVMIAAARRIGQARTVGDLLTEIAPEEYANTAVVLADETVLLPVLQAIPPTVPAMNVSMGYPCKMTSSADLIRMMLDLEEHSRDFDPRGFYYKDILRLIHHPFFTSRDPAFCTELTRKLTEWNQVVVSEAAWKGACVEHPDFAEWMRLWKDGTELLIGLKQLMAESLNGSIGRLEEEASRMIYRLCVQIERLAAGEGKLTFRTVRELITQFVSELRIPYVGEPLEGLQVLGILETRSLDFKNVILVSANEGTLPGAIRRDSSIPFELRQAWNLPTHDLHDGIYAYNYYRLLQRAERVFIIYDSETDELGRGERSRFVSQMTHELPSYNSAIKFREEVTKVPLALRGVSRTDQISKDAAVLSLLGEYLTAGVSASAIQSYLDCSMRFYYRYLVGLRPAEEIEESIDSLMFGTIVHESLNALYRELEGRMLTGPSVQELGRSISETVAKAAQATFRGGELRFGKNYLMIQVVQQWIARFVAWDAARAESRRVHLVGLETIAEKHLSLDGRAVRFFGRLDRQENVDGQSTVIDYKTGNVDDLGLKSLEEMNKNKMALQLAFYAWLHAKPGEDVPQTFIYSFRRTTQPLLSLRVDEKPLDATHMADLEKFLSDWVGELTDAGRPFVRTTEINRCQNCDFRVICQRHSRESTS